MNPTTELEVPQATHEIVEKDEFHRLEFIDGEWVERKMGARASRISVILSRLLDVHAEATQAGSTLNSDCGYKIFQHKPKLVRYPDVSFVRKQRLPEEGLPDGHMVIAPDLAVEVVSPNDLAEEIEERIMDYLRASVPLMWVIYPKARCVRVVRQGGKAQYLTDADELSGEDVLPGFTCRIAELLDTAPNHRE
jgi:Uma2 family endonuclease